MKTAKVVVDKDYAVARVDEKVFSSFVEPLGRRVYGGIYEPGHPMADENGFRKDVLDLTKYGNRSQPCGATRNWQCVV